MLPGGGITRRFAASRLRGVCVPGTACKSMGCKLRLDRLTLVTLGVRAARAKRVTTVDQVSMYIIKKYTKQNLFLITKLIDESLT